MPRRLTIALATVVLLCLLLFALFDTAIVRGTSMEPTYYPGSRVLVLNYFYCLRVGTVVVIEDPNEGTLIKRVAALPGQVVLGADPSLPTTGFLLLKEDEIWVLGDNLTASEDSRHFGPVKLASVSGVVIQ